jgi:hypothetical protein
MVNHEGKANRRFPRGVQVQSAWNEAPFTVAVARETSELARRLVAGRR